MSQTATLPRTPTGNKPLKAEYEVVESTLELHPITSRSEDEIFLSDGTSFRMSDFSPYVQVRDLISATEKWNELNSRKTASIQEHPKS